MLSCACCAYETANPQSFKRHNESAKHIKCLEKYNKEQIKTKEKEAESLKKQQKEAKKAEKEAEKEAEKAEKESKKAEKEQERLRRLEAKEKLDLLKYELLLKEAERKKLKQEKADAKLAKAEAKQEKKEEQKEKKEEEKKQEAVAFDYNMMTINDIDDNITFNWNNELEQNYFYPNLLMALAICPKTYNVRMVNDKVQLWEKFDDLPNGKWITEDDDVKEGFTFKDIETYCQGLTYNTKQLRNYKYQLDRHNDLLCHNPLYRSQCRQALGGFGDELRQQRKQREEQEIERVLSQREHIPTVDEARKERKKVGFTKPESDEEENQVIEDIEIESE